MFALQLNLCQSSFRAAARWDHLRKISVILIKKGLRGIKSVALQANKGKLVYIPELQTDLTGVGVTPI